MSPDEVAFLTMVIIAMSLFAIAIAYASFVASGNPSSQARHAAKVRDKRGNSAAKISNAKMPKVGILDPGI